MTQRLEPSQSASAATILRDGGTVVIPTETVYGLAADATNHDAVQKIFHAKGRPSDNPLIAHLYSPDQLDRYCVSIPELAYRLIERYSPGPLTLVLPKNDSIDSLVTAGLNTVAIRFPSHPTAREILRLCDRPLAAPSANVSGRPSSTTWQSALQDLEGCVDAIVCDLPTEIGIESTVVDVTQSPPVLLRPGAVTLEQLRELEPTFRTIHQESESQAANSPGLRYKHYQPSAQVVLCEHGTRVAFPRESESSSRRLAYIGMTKPSDTDRFEQICLCESIEEYARKIFEFFRTCDANQIQQIYCEKVNEQGLGMALMERISRAASK